MCWPKALSTPHCHKAALHQATQHGEVRQGSKARVDGEGGERNAPHVHPWWQGVGGGVVEGSDDPKATKQQSTKQDKDDDNKIDDDNNDSDSDYSSNNGEEGRRGARCNKQTNNEDKE